MCRSYADGVTHVSDSTEISYEKSTVAPDKQMPEKSKSVRANNGVQTGPLTKQENSCNRLSVCVKSSVAKGIALSVRRCRASTPETLPKASAAVLRTLNLTYKHSTDRTSLV